MDGKCAAVSKGEKSQTVLLDGLVSLWTGRGHPASANRHPLQCTHFPLEVCPAGYVHTPANGPQDATRSPGRNDPCPSMQQDTTATV